MNLILLPLIALVSVSDHSRDLVPKPDPAFSRVANSVALMSLPPDDCGACSTNVTVQYITPNPHYSVLDWTQSGTCTGWNVWETTNPLLNKTNWFLNTTKWNINNLSGKATTNADVRLIVFSTNNPVYWNVSAY